MGELYTGYHGTTISRGESILKINTTLFRIEKTNGLEMEYTFLKKI